MDEHSLCASMDEHSLTFAHLFEQLCAEAASESPGGAVPATRKRNHRKECDGAMQLPFYPEFGCDVS
jgi:hypothetical protein